MGSGCGFIIRLPLSGVSSAGLTLLPILLPSGLSGSAFNLIPLHYFNRFITIMVRLHTSLLAITLAMGSALASSNEYQRCSELDVNNQVPHHYFRFGHPCASAFDHSNFQSHDFVDEEDLFVRDLDAFDDLEARELLQIMEAEFGSKVAKHKRTKKFLTDIDYEEQIASAFQARNYGDPQEFMTHLTYYVPVAPSQ